MFIQIKAIRKACKPPRWRRAYLPMHMTFSQLAYILEVLLELPQTDQFEFEFYQEKDRLIESQENAYIPHSYEYSYWSARNSCVDDWLMSKTWFTFRIRGKDKLYPEYRVECEKLLDEIRFSTGNRETLSYPVILKEVSVKEDANWSDGTKVNQILRDSCFLKEMTPTYPSFSEVSVQIQNKQGIGVSSKLKSRDNLLDRSSRSIWEELGDSLRQLASQEQNEADEDIFSASSGYSQVRMNKTTLLDLLSSYTKADLMDSAEETGFRLTGSTKPKMASELAGYLLDPDVMSALLLDLTEEELNAFEAAIGKKRFLPADEDWNDLAAAYNLNYIAEYSDDTAEVPSDVALVYELIRNKGYRDYHADVRWLTECLIVFSLLYVVGPVRLLFRMYKQKKGSLTDYQEFLKLLKKIPPGRNPCRMIGNKLIVNEALEDHIYLAIESLQRDVPYYLPGEKEIQEYAVNGYPVSEAAYRKLSSFFREELKLESNLCNELCRNAFGLFSGGGMVSDYVDELEERGIAFSSEHQVNLFAKIIIDLNNHTRLFELKGHTPNEMRQLMPEPMSGRPPVIVPMSNMSSEILEDSRKELNAMGIEVDTESTADYIPVMAMPGATSEKLRTGMKKIYPNDPCPCGSGRKYKKCCGRK